MAKKVTMQQIADYMGVSKFVVSKALSGKGGVSESTKEKVIKAASQLGYFANTNPYLPPKPPEAPAEGGSKQSVLVLMPNVRFQTKESLYWGRILDGISARLEGAGLGMMIVMEQSADHFLQALNPNGILGMIGVGEISSSVLLEVHRLGVPFVLVDHEDGLIPSDTVFVNNYDSMHRLTNYLIGIGHKRLMFVGDPRYSRSFYDRWTGFRSAVEEQGLATDTPASLLIRLEGYEAFGDQIREVLEGFQRQQNLPTAFICANDTIALDAVQVLLGMGLKVPADVSVSGFDNIENSYQTSPSLTTVNVPKELMGARAVEKLLERVGKDQDATEKLLLSGEVMYRESTAGAAKTLYA
ncbi:MULTISPECIES: LacI family DNA-binding transcriptional regulator [Paenibacillus]|uniref:LacI family DNA-binding transcriptional regulator n=1 Tax=Paenibacillus TaxID=44249 RepID=UPI0022B8637C|nr:LacI family DNA-binding transcriptional regulator [Paenibacillus caseinilyticus]MCZ8517890.1 LacI family DNA-binding transcriptional regulator [Paenibacillus caseinilyticus]